MTAQERLRGEAALERRGLIECTGWEHGEPVYRPTARSRKAYRDTMRAIRAARRRQLWDELVDAFWRDAVVRWALIVAGAGIVILAGMLATNVAFGIAWGR